MKILCFWYVSHNGWKTPIIKQSTFPLKALVENLQIRLYIHINLSIKMIIFHDMNKQTYAATYHLQNLNNCNFHAICWIHSGATRKHLSKIQMGRLPNNGAIKNALNILTTSFMAPFFILSKFSWEFHAQAVCMKKYVRRQF